VAFLAFLLLALGVGFYATTAEERKGLLQKGWVSGNRLLDAAVENKRRCQPFYEALRARTRWAVVAPALAAMSVAILIVILVREGSLGNPQTLVEWGGSFGLRTTNGEWWRLLTATFVHTGVLELIVTLVALLSLGVAIERLVGSLAFAVIYVAAGVLSGLMRLSEAQMSVTTGSSGAVWGLFGLLPVWLALSLLRRSTVAVSLAALKRLAPAAALFLLYTAATTGIGRPAVLALWTGFALGLLLLVGTGGRKPAARRIAAGAASAAAIAIAVAVPLAGFADVRPEIDQVLTLEARGTETYNAAFDRFRKGRMSLSALTQTIDQTIVPPFQAAGERLKTFDKVPREQQSLLADAETYLRLRRESWQLRSEALRHLNDPVSGDAPHVRAAARHRTNLRALGKAEGRERESLEVLKRIRASMEKKSSREL
jgi:rhomboid protease GluP